MTGKHSLLGRRVVLVVVVVALVALAGCSSGGGDDAMSMSPPGDNETGTPGDDETPTNTTTGEPTLDGVTANASEALAEVEAFTLETTLQTTNATQSLSSNQTIRANLTTESVLVVDRSDLPGSTNTTLVTESYTTGETVFVRNRFPDQNFTFYERQNVTESLDNGSVGDAESTSLADRYEFKHDRTADGDHRFTADSPEQFVGTLPNGTVERLSAEVVVDAQSGLVTDVDTRLTATTDRGELTIQRGRTLSGLGTTTVATPEWLDTARNRTVQSPQSR